jgi:hypothetical protein
MRILEDLDSSYTARDHEQERVDLVHRLQAVAVDYSVRITILSGHERMAAVGRLYSRPDLNVPARSDHRYMVNVVSSPIVNKTHPLDKADLLARRNKMHHLDGSTDEILLDIFDKDPGDSIRTEWYNTAIMPSRNYAMLTENSPSNEAEEVPPSDAVDLTTSPAPPRKDERIYVAPGEVNAGTKHKAAGNQYGKRRDGSLDIRILVEIDQGHAGGLTEPYGLTIPCLEYEV